MLVIIAGSAPFGKTIGESALDRSRQGVTAAQHHGVAGFDCQIDAAADKPGASLEGGDARRAICCIGFDIVNAGLQQPDAAARNIDLGACALTQLAQMKIDPPVFDADLHNAIAQIGDVELAVFGDVDRVRANAEFGTGSRVGCEPSSGRGRKVDLGRRPVGVPGLVEGEGTGDKAHPTNSGGWLLLGECRSTAEKSKNEKSFRNPAHKPIP